MLWTMVLHLALTFKGGLGVVACFALFAFWAGVCFFFSLLSVYSLCDCIADSTVYALATTTLGVSCNYQIQFRDQ